MTALRRALRWLGRALTTPNDEVRCELLGQVVTVEVACSERAIQRGLAGRPDLGRDRALALRLPAQSGQGAISTRGMRFVIDVVFLDEKGRVLEVASELAPGLFPGHPVPPGAAIALELNSGRAESLGLVEGRVVSELDVASLASTDVGDGRK